ncbi:hypothetical protein [Polaromonas sp.]|uniref:hypothetical protein n=1 Tax=Polaromonas sp. TaxID=1869339 RepID=UPI00352A3E0A
MSDQKMTREDFVSVRNFLRWAKVGVQPDVRRADDALEVLGAYKKAEFSDVLASVGTVADEVRRGVMPSFENCKAAEKVLSDVFFKQADLDSHMERDRG